MAGREIKPEGRANLHQDRQEKCQIALDFACLNSEQSRQHHRLIVGFTAGTSIFESAAFAFEFGNARQQALILGCARRLGFHLEIIFAE
jgi:hypothetical protein